MDTCNGTGSPRRRLVFGLCLAGSVIALPLAMLLPILYGSLATEHPMELAFAAWLQFVGALWLVASQPEQGALISQQRNWAITTPIAVARLGTLAAFSAALAVASEHKLLAVSLAQATGMWAGWALLRTRLESIPPMTEASLQVLSVVRHRLNILTASMVSWAIGMAVVQYGVTPYVSYLAPHQTASAFAAITLGVTLSGVFSAILGGLLAPLARLAAGKDKAKMRSTMGTVATWCFIVVTIVFGACLLGLDRLLAIWLGGKILPGGGTMMLWLLLQQYVRSVSAPAAVLLTVSGSPRVVALAPLFESGGSLLIAIPMGAVYGVEVFASTLFFVAATAALLTWWLVLRSPAFQIGRARWRGLVLQATATVLSVAFIVLYRA